MMAKLNLFQRLAFAKIEARFERQISAIKQGTNPKKEFKLRQKFSRLYLKSEADYTDENGSKVDEGWLMNAPINNVLDFVKVFFKDIVEDIE